jgi:hypothetical protein
MRDLQMNAEILLEQPTLRRCWLLSKALESEPLDKALELARAADAFLVGAVARLCPEGPQGADKRPRPAGISVSRVDGAISQTRHDQRQSLVPPTRSVIVPALDSAAAAPDPAPAAVAHLPTDSAPAGAEDPPNGEALFALAEAGLATLASIDDVVRYLRQRDDVVVRAEGGAFLLNARFRMTAGELVSRANRMRARDRKPPFQLTPLIFAGPANVEQSVSVE